MNTSAWRVIRNCFSSHNIAHLGILRKSVEVANMIIKELFISKSLQDLDIAYCGITYPMILINGLRVLKKLRVDEIGSNVMN